MNEPSTDRTSASVLRRLMPRRVRTRLTLLYTSLFLAGGIVLLG